LFGQIAASIEEKKMEDMPIWFKIAIYVTVSLTAFYTLWGIIQTVMQP
jgi:hypothetical protein